MVQSCNIDLVVKMEINGEQQAAWQHGSSMKQWWRHCSGPSLHTATGHQLEVAVR